MLIGGAGVLGALAVRDVDGEGAGVLGALAVRDVDGREKAVAGTIREIVVELDFMLACISPSTPP